MQNNKIKAFTLAEVVVVLGILSVMMIAFAPVMTKKANSGSFTNLWQSLQGHTGIYYGTSGDTKTVILGESSIDASISDNLIPRLLLVSGEEPQLAFGTTSASNIYPLKVNANTNALAFGTAGTTSTMGQNSIALGFDTVANGQNAIAIGNGTRASQQNSIAIGGTNASNTMTEALAQNSVAIGFGVQNTTANSIRLGTATDTVYIPGTLIAPEPLTSSDRRLKNVGKEFNGGVEDINKLTFYNFTYKRDKAKTPHVGVMAQDLQKVFPNAVMQNDDGYLYIRKEDMFYAGLNAVKDLYKKLVLNTSQIEDLKKENEDLTARCDEIEKRIEELENR